VLQLEKFLLSGIFFRSMDNPALFVNRSLIAGTDLLQKKQPDVKVSNH
jgi:hypothetical protein